MDNSENIGEKLKVAEAELSRTQSELAKLKGQLQATTPSLANGDRSRLSQDLRTPLNTILGFGQLLQSATEATAESISEILRAGNRLLEMISELDTDLSENGSTPRADPPVAPAPLPEPEFTILYIEDNGANLMLVQHILQQRPSVKLLSAVRGSAGLELARTSRPDLILLDLNLPDIDGADLLKDLRKQRETESVPVIVVSADAIPSRIERLLAAGARNYVTKPFNVRRFLHTIDEALQKRTESLTIRN